MSEALKRPLNDLFLAHLKTCSQCKSATVDRRMALCFKGIRLLTGKPPTRPPSDGGAA